MGGREVNSTAPKLYLIFIHMNAPGRDRLPQTNWNAWDQGGLQRGKQKKALKMGGGGVSACVCVYEFLRVYKEGRIHWYGWKDTNHYSILIFSPPAYIHTPLLFSVTHQNSTHSSWCHLPFKRYCRWEVMSKLTEVLMARWTIKPSNKPSFPLLSLSFCLHEYPLHTHNQFLILCPFLSLSLIKHTIK